MFFMLAGRERFGMETKVEKKKIWVLEDESEIRSLYTELLGENHSISTFSSLTDFTRALAEQKVDLPDLLVADIHLAQDSFLEYLEKNSTALPFPVLVVSANWNKAILHKCFEKGVRDYVTKPCRNSELLAKIERLLETTELSLDPISFRATRKFRYSETLTSKEYQILSLLKTAPERRISRTELFAAVWDNVRVSSKTLDVHIFNLRKKIKPLGVDIELQAPDIYRLEMNEMVAPRDN